MKVTHPTWAGWSVYIKYTDDKSVIQEYAPAHLTAEQTGKNPIDVVYLAVEDNRPFCIVAVPSPARPYDVAMASTIDGVRLCRNGILCRSGSTAPLCDFRWCDKSSGVAQNMNYKFAPINFVDNGPIPPEALLYGSIAVTLQGVKCWERPIASLPHSPRKTPAGTIDSSMEDDLTDTFVRGTAVGESKKADFYPYRPLKSIPKATVVFKYASRDVLIENGIIPDKLDDKSGHHVPPPTVYGGKTLKPSDTPLTVIYDPTEDIGAGCLRWPRFLCFKKKQTDRREREADGKGTGKKQ